MVAGPDHVPTRSPRLAEAPVSYVVSAILLLSAFVALLWVPSYAHLEPSLGGLPFFYWYSILWLLINAACQFVAYQLLVVLPRRRAAAGAASSAAASTGDRP